MEKMKTGDGELYWKGFKLPDGKQRWLCTSDANQIKISKADWFNRQTEYIYCCVFGQKLFWRQKWTPLQKQGLCLQRWNIV